MVEREEIIQFVKERLGFEPTSTTKFWWNTGTAGLDAWAFMEQFADQYDVNMDDAAKDIDYGDSEGGIGEALDRIWKRMTLRSVRRTGYFTIDHLVEVANSKKWFDPSSKS